MIKRWAIFFLTLVLFTTTATAANTCTFTDDIILRLSSATNAHAELYDQTTPTYDEEICFSDFFPNESAPSIPLTAGVRTRRPRMTSWLTNWMRS